VLLDVLGADPRFGATSREALRRAYDSGALLACDVVWAEVRAWFGDERTFEATLASIGVRFDPIGPPAAALAGDWWRRYRRLGRGPRERLVADFLVGAHARRQADVLLTRDRGFARRWFAGLRVVDPATS
jgi:predicted nucleic acid-binding protein